MSDITTKTTLRTLLEQVAERADDASLALLDQVWTEVQGLLKANKSQAKALKALQAANEELEAQRHAIATEYENLINDIGDGTILGQIVQGQFGHTDLGEALYEMRRALDDQARDNIIEEIGYILGGHRWSDYSLRDLIALLTQERPAEFSPQRVELFRRELRATYERVIEFGPEGEIK